MLGRRIADYLVEHGWITPAQVEEARRTQGFFGGRLETHLMKLGHVSESVMGDALTEISGTPFVSWERLRSASASALQALPLALIQRHRVCPFHLDEGRLRVATLSPRDAVAIREMEAATGLVIEPWIAIEPRLYQAIERHFRVRFQGTTGLTMPHGPDRGPRTQPTVPTDEPPAPPPVPDEIGLDGRPLDAEPLFEDYVGSGSEAGDGAIAGSIDALDDALAGARDRDEMAEALFAFCAERASRCALFAVGKEAVRGVAGRGRAFSGDAVRKVSVPIGSGTLFDTARESREFYFGIVPALPANRDLYTALGGRLPANVMLLPIVVKERTVAWLYLDGDGAPLPRPDIPLMRRIAVKAGIAFEMLLLRNKLRDV